MKKLPIEFYDRTNVVVIAKELIGKILVSKIDDKTCVGRIVETEAYIGLTDRASHSFGGKRTARNEDMYAAAGTAYVYICYGMHQLVNVVTNKKDIPDAILIRAVEPLEGIEHMLQRTKKKKLDFTLTKGPGNVGKAFGIFKHHSNTSLFSNEIYIAQDEILIDQKSIGSSRRIGVESAGEAALYPYRFYLKGNKFVSGYPIK